MMDGVAQPQDAEDRMASVAQLTRIRTQLGSLVRHLEGVVADDEPGEAQRHHLEAALSAARSFVALAAPYSGGRVADGPALLPERILSILSIDQDASARTLATNHLEALGHEPSEACSAADGVAKALLNCPDLVLMDVQGAELSGLDGLRLFRRLWPIMPVLAMTGSGVHALMRRAGYADVLSKPLDIAELRDALDLVAVGACADSKPVFNSAALDQIAADLGPVRARDFVNRAVVTMNGFRRAFMATDKETEEIAHSLATLAACCGLDLLALIAEEIETQPASAARMAEDRALVGILVVEGERRLLDWLSRLDP